MKIWTFFSWYKLTEALLLQFISLGLSNNPTGQLEHFKLGISHVLEKLKFMPIYEEGYYDFTLTLYMQFVNLFLKTSQMLKF